MITYDNCIILRKYLTNNEIYGLQKQCGYYMSVSYVGGLDRFGDYVVICSEQDYNNIKNLIYEKLASAELLSNKRQIKTWKNKLKIFNKLPSWENRLSWMEKR